MEALNQFAPFILMFAVIYFLMIRPQMKRSKQEKTFVQEIKKGDKVVTKGGMHGKIVELTDDSCVIETLAGKIKFERSAILWKCRKKQMVL